MTPKERVIQAINHNETDILPYTVDMYDEIKEKMKDFYHDSNFSDKFNNHLFFIAAKGFPREKWINDNVWQDHFGVQWDRSMDKGVGINISPLFTEDSFDSYVFPDPTDASLFSTFPEAIEKEKDKFIIASVVMSYFERSWALYGFENVLMEMAVNEEFMFKLLGKILEYNLKLIDEYLKFNIDCIHINDDYGQQSGLIMGPVLWRKFFKPGLKTMSERIKSKGKLVYLHSCGNISEIMPDLIEIGIDIINPLQPEVMDVFKLKEEFGAKITFHGGISEQKTLNFGTPDDVESEMKEKIKKLGKGGGYIIAPSQGMTRDIPAENVDRFIKIVTSQ